MRVRATAARSGLALLLVLMAGCSLLVPHFERPTLSVLSVQVLRAELWRQELKVRLRVQNPNDRELPIKGLSYTLDLEGQQFAHGESYASFTVPALGEADFDMSVSANLTSLALRVLSRNGNEVHYHIAGHISLSSGLWRSMNFDDHGSFRWQ
jgi:LEA14-like dessication related protein